MKKEFKKGDRVLVRKNDLRRWQEATLLEVYDGEFWSGPFRVRLPDKTHNTFAQCRHIDDFHTGDKVQVRSSVTEEWEDATYAVYVPNDSFEHWVFSEDMDDLFGGYKFCRWHPSMPWAEKEQPLTLEQRVEALERKLNEQ